MRVLHVTPYFAPAFRYGGPPRSILGLCRALGRADVDVEVFTTTANGDEPLPAAPDGVVYDGVFVRYFPLAFPERRWRAAGLASAVRAAARRANLVHVHGLWNFAAWSGIRAARAQGIAYAVSPRGMLQPAAIARRRWWKAGALVAAERDHLRRAALLHATSRAEEAVLREFGPRVVLVPNGVTPVRVSGDDISCFRRGAEIADDDEVVTVLGRIHPIKRLDLAAAAFAEVLRRRPRARLVVAGPDEDGHRAALEPLFASLGRAVVWTGTLDDRETWALLASTRVLLQCSDSESFGMSVAEALTSGVPVVVTERGAFDQVDAIGCGFVARHDPADIADRLVTILADAAAARAMGERGREWASARFAWDGLAASMIAAYAAVVEQSAVAG